MSASKLLLLPLKEADTSIDLVGGKALNLAKMLQWGLPVPDGFVVTIEAYQACSGSKLTATLSEEIVSAIERLGVDELYAVRSSASAEDWGDASMAGQYETFLNLKSPQEILCAIEDCWNSLKTERTQAYLAEQGIDINQVAMAVIVQKQVKSETSGVLFTVDPKCGDRDVMILEAVWGLGESLVSGEVQPDVVRIKKSALEVLSYHVACKKEAIYPGNSTPSPVEELIRERACLNFNHLKDLHQLGIQAETFFGGPQDVEWAIEANRVYLLQSRAITTLDGIDAFNEILSSTKQDLANEIDEKRGPWVRHNLGETLPHPTTLTWSIIAPYMSGNGGFGKMYQQLGFKPGPIVEDRSFLRRICGEIYMDCSLMAEMFAKNYPFAYDTSLLRENPNAAQQPPSKPVGNLKELSIAAKLANKAFLNIDQMAGHLDKDFDQIFVPEITQWAHQEAGKNLSAFNDQDLIKTWERQTDKVLNYFGPSAFLPSMVEAVAVDKLKQQLEAYAWRDDIDKLLASLSVSKELDKTLQASIDRDRLDDQTWLGLYGHRATSEFELASPRWIETPEILKTIQAQDIATTHKTRLKASEAALEKMAQELKNSEIAKIREATELAQRYLRFREDGKFYFMLAYAQLRRTALEFGQRLQIGNDVFHLQADEMLKSLKSGFVPLDKISKRRLQYKAEKRIVLPHVIDSEDIRSLGSPIKRAEGDTLKAFSLSTGFVSGVANIVKEPRKADNFVDGGILVCPSTDPSWTPLFTRASGLVMERGGSLSHGAVVAREIGLPAVILDGATEILKEGESITLDANAGFIWRDDESKLSFDNDSLNSLKPPPLSIKEAHINKWGVIIGLFWTVVLLAFFLLPPTWFKEPIFSFYDGLLWPLIRQFGMIGSVGLIAIFFGFLPIFMQKLFTDNARILEAKERSTRLRKKAATLPQNSAKRKELESLAAPTTSRILKASMVPLAFILGPMIILFMWFPVRVDPLSWNANPGRMVSVVAEVDGDFLEPIQMQVPEPLALNSKISQSLPPIRSELEELSREWAEASDLSDLPWEVQSAADHARLALVSSLDNYLRTDIPPQKLSWLIHIPETALGIYPISLRIGSEETFDFNLVFGQSAPPMPNLFTDVSPQLLSLQINYPRPLKKASFFKLPLLNWDIGWLGIYLLFYLPAMFIAKALLRVP
ncbi:MAG: PEP/pyruvate-binding domain-containing protein [Verrucomicrobiota bacterium]